MNYFGNYNYPTITGYVQTRTTTTSVPTSTDIVQNSPTPTVSANTITNNVPTISPNVTTYAPTTTSNVPTLVCPTFSNNTNWNNTPTSWSITYTLPLITHTVTGTSGVTTTPYVTGTHAVTGTSGVTTTNYVTGTHTVTGTSGVTTTNYVTGTHTVTGTSGVITTNYVTGTHTVTGTSGVTTTNYVTGTHTVTGTNGVTTTNYVTGSSSVTASFTPEQLMSQINTLINSFKQGNIQLGNLRNKLIELGATCIIIDPNLYGNTYVRFQGPDGKNYEITTNSTAPDSYRENLRKDVEQNKDEYYSSVSSKITKEIFDIRFEELLNSASYDELRNFDKYFEENIFVKNTNNITQDIIKITQQLKEHYEQEYAFISENYSEEDFDKIYSEAIKQITDFYEGEQLSLIALSIDMENLIYEQVNKFLYNDYYGGSEQENSIPVNRVKGSSSEAKQLLRDSEGREYYYSEYINENKERIAVYDYVNGPKKILNHGKQPVQPFSTTYQIGDTTVTVQSTVKLNEFGIMVFDENGYAGTVTIEKNGEKTVIPLEINMPLYPTVTIEGRNRYINYNEQMQDANAFIETFINNVFKGLSEEALDYFSKECDILRFKEKYKAKRETGRFEYYDKYPDTPTGERVLSEKANRMTLILDPQDKNYYNATTMQTSFLHELGHGVASYTNLKSTGTASNFVDLSKEKQSWINVYNEVCKYVQDNNLNSKGTFDYILKPIKIEGTDYYSNPKQELFAEFFAYSMGIKANGMNYSTLFETIKNNNPALFSKITSSFNEILTEINSLKDDERKYSSDRNYKEGLEDLKPDKTEESTPETEPIWEKY